VITFDAIADALDAFAKARAAVRAGVIQLGSRVQPLLSRLRVDDNVPRRVLMSLATRASLSLLSTGQAVHSRDDAQTIVNRTLGRGGGSTTTLSLFGVAVHAGLHRHTVNVAGHGHVPRHAFLIRDNGQLHIWGRRPVFQIFVLVSELAISGRHFLVGI
jgi:hypothetical protein